VVPLARFTPPFRVGPLRRINELYYVSADTTPRVQKTPGLIYPNSEVSRFVTLSEASPTHFANNDGLLGTVESLAPLGALNYLYLYRCVAVSGDAGSPVVLTQLSYLNLHYTSKSQVLLRYTYVNVIL
jgi:hypothetical protein